MKKRKTGPRLSKKTASFFYVTEFLSSEKLPSKPGTEELKTTAIKMKTGVVNSDTLPDEVQKNNTAKGPGPSRPWKRATASAALAGSAVLGRGASRCCRGWPGTRLARPPGCRVPLSLT